MLTSATGQVVGNKSSHQSQNQTATTVSGRLKKAIDSLSRAKCAELGSQLSAAMKLDLSIISQEEICTHTLASNLRSRIVKRLQVMEMTDLVMVGMTGRLNAMIGRNSARLRKREKL